MASTLKEHSGLICNYEINNNNVRITIKNIKAPEGTCKDVVYKMSGGEINVYYFTNNVKHGWELTDTKFNFNYREIIKHEKKVMISIKDEINSATKKMESVRVAEETVSLYFRDTAVLFRVSA